VLTDTASPEDPALTATHLMLSTSAGGENISYGHFGAGLQFPDPLIIEFRARFESGSWSTDSRAPLAVLFTTSPDVGNALYVRTGQIFLNVDNNIRGPTAALDTASFHTYRTEVTAAGVVEVFYDGALTLTGSVFISNSHNSATPRVVWGEVSTFAQGTSEWVFLRHNAHATGCDQDNDGFQYADDCNDLDQCTYPGAPEICDGLDNDCDLVPDGAGVVPPGPIKDLQVLVDAATLRWIPCGGCSYDVVKGDLGALRSAGGDFSMAVTSCLEDDSLDAYSLDPAIVPPGTVGFFYLVRGEGHCGHGTYDSGYRSQVAPRDAGISASTTDCP